MPKQRTYYSLRTHVFPDDFPQRLERFKVESGLSWAEIARRLGTYPLTIRRWRYKGVRPNLAHQMALFDLADDLGLGHIFTEWSVQRETLHDLPVFLSFIRQPFCVAFRIPGHPGTQPYELMAINAHLYFGNYITDRRQEFNALTDWIMSRLRAHSSAYYPNFMLLGDLNLDYDNPATDRARIEQRIKGFNLELEGANVNFPFLDVHPQRQDLFRTNARLTETFDQIGLFNRDPRLPTYADNAKMGSAPTGPDYGVFEFGNLFSEALLGRPYLELSSGERADLVAKFEHKVSDHLPLWVRLPLPVR